MDELFGIQAIAAGYATCRPPVQPYVIERIHRYLRPPDRPHRALDVGCGAGLSTKPLGQICRQCFGIEPVEAMLRFSSTVAPEAHFIVGSAEELPISSHSIDLITAAGSLNYADLSLFFREAIRVLTPGGILVVYDFSQGRAFRDSASLSEWFAEFTRRYPPPKSGQRISPESLSSLHSGFTVQNHEHFEIGLTLSPDFYLDYVMTETNVADAVRQGTPESAIRSWCASTLGSVFQGAAREVLFQGYIAYMIVAGCRSRYFGLAGIG